MLEIKENIPLDSMTTFRIGGNAKYFAEVMNGENLLEAVQYAKEKNIQYYIIGGGSNVLINDKGFNGIVIKMKMQQMRFEKEVVEIEAGVSLIKAINAAARAGLSGMEMLAGIPGTVGGAVRGNAGAYGVNIGDVVESVLAFDTETGEYKVFSYADCNFIYRSSFFKTNKRFIIVSVKVSLKKDVPALIVQRIEDTIKKRVTNHLAGEKSAGSYFMNPVVTDLTIREKFEKDRGVLAKDGKLPAGWIIDQLDLRGKKIGGAMISDKHANYIINTGDATAEDVIMLESFIKQQVRDKFGVQLQAEVNYVGF